MTGQVSQSEFHEDPYSILTFKPKYEGWEFNIGIQRAFYIRGATWLRSHVIRDVSELKRAYKKFESISESEAHWRQTPFPWEERFSHRQAMDGLSLRKRRPLRFYKAVQTLLLIEAYISEFGEEIGHDKEKIVADMYEHVRIQPSIFYLKDFSIDKFEWLKRRRDNLIDELRMHTGQTSGVVFHEMATGHTVTRPLAAAVAAHISELRLDNQEYALGYRWHSGLRGASTHETLSDAPPRDWPIED